MTPTAFSTASADFLAEVLVDHAAHLGEHQRGDAVVVHLVPAVGGEQAVGLLHGQHPADASLDGLAVLALARHVAGGKEGHHRQAGDGDVLAAAPGRPGAHRACSACWRGTQGLVDRPVNGRLLQERIGGRRRPNEKSQEHEGNKEVTHRDGSGGTPRLRRDEHGEVESIRAWFRQRLSWADKRDLRHSFRKLWGGS